MNRSAKKQVLVIAGTTGSGESTVTQEIIKRHPNFIRLVTATTRPKRLNEQEGIDYYFFSKEAFQREMAQGNILEHQNNRDSGVYYGSYKPDLEQKLAANKIVIVNPDIVGARFYKEHYNATTVFIAPESLADIRTRLLAREPNLAPEYLESRLAYAQRELTEESPYYDYKIINRQNKLEEAMAELEKILKKEGYAII